MQQLANQISEIIHCYREDDIGVGSYNTIMTPEHVLRWVNQFDVNDRRFLLRELLQVLPLSYFSKSDTDELLKKGLEKISLNLGYDSISQFLSFTKIVHRQKKYKSQSDLLTILDKIVNELSNISILDAGRNEIKHWLYVDDVLASGGSFRKEITEEINNYNINNDFNHSSINIICLFIGVHNLGQSNVMYSLNKNLEWKISNRIKIYRRFTIENDIKNPNSKLNIAYPKKSHDGLDFLEFIENAFPRKYPMRNENIAFRDANLPFEESFFSSPESRDRYESIILKKGIELIYNINNLNVQSIRPLGMTNPSNKTLGTGSHFFTWRNISNTCPIVFWWEANGWYPLFPVKNRGL